MKLSQKTILTCSTLVAAVLLLSFCFYKNVAAESTYPASVYVTGTELPNDYYLANEAEEATPEKPAENGYVYYKDGVVTLNNAKLCTKDEDEDTDTAGIWADSDITIQVNGNNQIGKAVDSPSEPRDDQLYMGIIAADNLHSDNFYNITVNGSGNLTIYDLTKGILGENITIDMNGNLTIVDYGTEKYAMAECCLKADGGSLYINNGNLDLRSYLSCCMYADNGIYITAGNIATRTSSMGGKHALNCEPVFDKNNYTVETSNEIDVDKSAEMEAWNGTDALSSFYRVNFTNVSTSTSTPTPSPVPIPTSTSDATTKKNTSIKKVTWKSLKNKKKKKAVASWKKVSKASGYQLQYATNKKFKSKKTVQTKKTKYTIKKLKKKTYYVRVRAYKGKGKNKIYGKWSNVKKVKIKK